MALLNVLNVERIKEININLLASSWTPIDSIIIHEKFHELVQARGHSELKISNWQAFKRTSVSMQKRNGEAYSVESNIIQ